jgi:DNA polymerase
MNNADKRLAYLQAMGVQAWVPREASPAMLVNPAGLSEQPPLPTQTFAPTVEPNAAMPQPDALSVPPARDVSRLDWPQLQAAVTSCFACGLHETRTQIVFGTGDMQARWMIIGEAPGAEEDRQGEPFVGRAGKLLDNMLRAIGLQRGQVFIANMLKCRPPNNRDPRPEEVACCEPFLRRQVELVQPRVILAVGRIAAQNLLKVDTPLGRLRGKLHHYGDTPVVVTYHPAYLLRKPSEKAKTWTDLCFALSVCGVTDDGIDGEAPG